MTRCSMNRGLFSLNITALAAAAGIATLVAAPQQAHAGIAPDTYMSVEIRDTSQNTLFNSGEVNLQSIGVGNMISGFTYTNPQGSFPALDDSRYNSSGFILSRTEQGVLPVALFENMTFENKSSNTLEFIINYRMPLTTTINDPLVDWFADSTWNLGGPNDPAVNTIPISNGNPQGYSLFTAFVNGNEVGTQHDHPSGFGGSGGELILNAPTISGTVAGPVSELSIRLAFSLTSAASVGIQSNITIPIPAPAAAPLLAMAGLIAGRRRRRR